MEQEKIEHKDTGIPKKRAKKNKSKYKEKNKKTLGSW
jgi:hypothetical protein